MLSSFAARRIISGEMVRASLKSDSDDIVTDSTNASMFSISDVSDGDGAILKAWINAFFVEMVSVL